jgi:hypothetical protein
MSTLAKLGKRPWVQIKEESELEQVKNAEDTQDESHPDDEGVEAKTIAKQTKPNEGKDNTQAALEIYNFRKEFPALNRRYFLMDKIGEGLSYTDLEQKLLVLRATI